MTEQEMMDHKVPTFDNEEDLVKYCRDLIEQEHDYGTSARTASLCAVAWMNYIARKLGLTGFQMSCADMDVLERMRRFKGPWAIINAEDQMYPQYDGKIQEITDGWKEWLKEEAKKRLREPGNVHDKVKSRWQELAAS